MTRMTAVLAGLLLIVLAAGGCKMVTITFNNLTEKPAELELEGPHMGKEDIGVVAAGGKMIYDVKIFTFRLPATFELEAASYKTKFTVTEHTPDSLSADITSQGIVGPRETAGR